MDITFEPLNESHFPLMLAWLESAHVKKWWDRDVVYTPDLIKEKYGDYVKGCKQVNGVNKSIHAYIICVNHQPIGYIQIYNAYDFPRSKSLRGLPESLGAFDIFIGDEKYLRKNIGSQAITKFLSLYATHYSYVFADPDLENVAAIRAYEKAGFKKVLEQNDTEEVWMLWERPKALQTITKLVMERYSHAKAVFWAGSVSQNKGTPSSDLDLVAVFDSIPNAYREAFIYDSWPIDAFIHDPDSLRYFFKKLEFNDGRPALIQMILDGQEILGANDFSKNIKELAQETLKTGPAVWSKEQVDKERFLITDILDDIKFPQNRDEQTASAAHLFEPLIQFYFRARGQWAASGKSLIRHLKSDNPVLALEFSRCFELLFQTGNTAGLESLVQKVLAPYGGLLWDGFRADAPEEWKIRVS